MKRSRAQMTADVQRACASPEGKALFSIAHREQYVRAVAVKGSGVELRFQGLPLAAALRLVQLLDVIRAEQGVPVAPPEVIS